jgi:hypothetical protein
MLGRQIRADFPILGREVHGKPLVTWTTLPHRRSRRQSSRPWTTTTGATTPTSTAACTPWPRRRLPPTRRRAQGGPFHQCLQFTRGCLCPQHDGGHQPRGHGWGRKNLREGTSSSLASWSTTPTSCPGSCWPRPYRGPAGVHRIGSRGPPGAGWTWTGSGGPQRARAVGGNLGDVERIGHDQPRRRGGCPCAQGRSALAGGWSPERASLAG